MKTRIKGEPYWSYGEVHYHYLVQYLWMGLVWLVWGHKFDTIEEAEKYREYKLKKRAGKLNKIISDKS